MIAAIKPAGSNTRGLLACLYGPGRHDEHLDPHLVAGFAMLGMPDPGRDENATLTELGHYLDAPVRLRNSEFGQPVTDHVGDRTGTRRPTQDEMHKAARLGWEQTSREWLQGRIRAAIPHATTAEELLAYLEADGVAVKARRAPSGDLIGYAVGRPGDLNKDDEQIFHPGGKVAPDLTLPKLKARLETSRPGRLTASSELQMSGTGLLWCVFRL